MANRIRALNEKLRTKSQEVMGEPPYWMVAHCRDAVEDDEESGWVPMMVVGIFPAEEREQAIDMAKEETITAFPEIMTIHIKESEDGDIAVCDGDDDLFEPLVGVFCIGPEHFQLGFELEQIVESKVPC